MSYPVRTVGLAHCNWGNLIHTDPAIPSISKHLALYLATYMNSRNQCAWPSLARISSECGYSVSTVCKHLNELVDNDWLARKRGGQESGKNVTSRYAISFPEVIKEGGGTPSHEVPLTSKEGGGTPSHGEGVLRETESNQQKESTKVLKDTVKTASFTDFWKLWPRKVAKREAAKAWKKLSPTELMFVAMVANLEAHANAGDWSDPQYIPHPATWLNGRRWEDAVHPVKDKTPGDHNPPEQNFTSEKQSESRRWRDKLKDRQLGYPL
ncbi:MAG: helix-turn-helix domain-containing protein [Desulfobacteraceae bacterium]|nr:helix-turn-helix domain-containing protein [Desulfobacteraceae bacterium]